MCITSETCRANSVIKTALNNFHQAVPNKTHTPRVCLPNFRMGAYALTVPPYV